MQLRRGCKGWWQLLLIAAADRITKAAVMRLPAGARPLWPGVINVRRAGNSGMAFSMLSGQRLLLSISTLLIVAAIVGWLIAHPEAKGLTRIGLWWIAGGGLGNLYDRLTLGYVIDFIEPAFVRFAVFNIADAGICLGAAMVAIGALMEERHKRRHGHAGV